MGRREVTRLQMVTRWRGGATSLQCSRKNAWSQKSGQSGATRQLALDPVGAAFVRNYRTLGEEGSEGRGARLSEMEVPADAMTTAEVRSFYMSLTKRLPEKAKRYPDLDIDVLKRRLPLNKAEEAGRRAAQKDWDKKIAAMRKRACERATAPFASRQVKSGVGSPGIDGIIAASRHFEQTSSESESSALLRRPRADSVETRREGKEEKERWWLVGFRRSSSSDVATVGTLDGDIV